MASWKDTFKAYLTTDTMKNPLDTMFPTLRKKLTGDNPPVIKPSPLKAKVNEEVKGLSDSLTKYLPLLVVVVLVFALGNNK